MREMEQGQGSDQKQAIKKLIPSLSGECSLDKAEEGAICAQCKESRPAEQMVKVIFELRFPDNGEWIMGVWWGHFCLFCINNFGEKPPPKKTVEYCSLKLIPRAR